MIKYGEKMAKNCQKMPKIDPKSSEQHQRLPEKPLKTVLIHQNEHHRPNRGKVALLEFDCDHFKGLHCRVLRRAVFQGGGVA